jgi:ABC-type Mn2+/Zn2+ transport system ATPase subunit
MPYILKALMGNIYGDAEYKGKRIIWGLKRPKVDIYSHEIPDHPYQRLEMGEPIHREGLSGGQWQRIALARAFMKIRDADLLILDEPSSALDPQAEYQVFKTIMELRRNKTTLFIVDRP